VLKALAERNNINTAEVDDVIWGTSSQRGTQGGDLGRMSALDAGYDVRSQRRDAGPLLRLGHHLVNLAAATIMSGMEDLVIAGGTEMMSMPNRRDRRGRPPMFDTGNLHLRARIRRPIRASAPTPSRRWKASRARPSTRWRWKASSAPTPRSSGHASTRAWCPSTRGRHARARPRGIPASADDDGRPAALKPSFEHRRRAARRGRARPSAADPQVYPDLKIKHIHHAGNSSGVVDGAAAVLLASPITPKARPEAARPRRRDGQHGRQPDLMLNAPVPAARKVLAKAGLTLDDIDLFEINEAFAVVAEKFIRDLKLDRDKVNVNGGAMALGHPIGATGSMLIGTMLDELERRDLKRGLVTMCAAGGMAPAIIIECHPGQAMRQHRAGPGPRVQFAPWVPGLAPLARDDRWGFRLTVPAIDHWQE
jgi:acetyl-CoA C-acetyltransferase